MDLIDQLKALAAKIEKQKGIIRTEEATKNAFVMPFIQLLGYNVFDPSEVTPELDADVGLKKGEKVDYAILKDDKPVILFECKSCTADLETGVEHMSQLYRYFNTTTAKIGILTNGIIYRFYSDLEEKNKMDPKPFLELDMLNIRESLVEELKRFKKEDFNIDSILSAAEELKYIKEIKRILNDEMTSPSEDFIKYFFSKFYNGRITQALKDRFQNLTQRACTQYIAEKLNDRLKSAMQQEPPATSIPTDSIAIIPGKEIITTDEEKEAYLIIKSIARQIIDVSKIVMRDAQTYCSILFDDNNRKPVARLYFNNLEKKIIGIFLPDKSEEKIPLVKLDDIYKYSDKILAVVKGYNQSGILSATSM